MKIIFPEMVFSIPDGVCLTHCARVRIKHEINKVSWNNYNIQIQYLMPLNMNNLSNVLVYPVYSKIEKQETTSQVDNFENNNWNAWTVHKSQMLRNQHVYAFMTSDTSKWSGSF